MWHVHYTTMSGTKAVVGMTSFGSLPLALDHACKIIGEGANVLKIDGSRVEQGMTAAEIMNHCDGLED